MNRFDKFPEALVDHRISATENPTLRIGNDLLNLRVDTNTRANTAVEVLRLNPNAPISPELLEALVKVASWEVLPPILNGKRTAWVQPSEPVGRIRGISIKGVGLNKDGKVTPPKKERYDGIFDKQGFHPDGSPYRINELVEPVGGFSMAAALQEWEATLGANASGVHATTPLALAQYPNLEWEGTPMGVLILGSPNAHDMRLFDLMRLGVKHPYVKDRLDPKETMGEFLCRVYRSIGIDTAKLHTKQKGHRLQPHSGNFSFDFEARRTIFNDLEQVDAFTEPAPIQGLYMLEDIKFVISTLKDSLVTLMIGRRIDLEEAREVIISFLCGYFGNECYNQAHHFAVRTTDPARQMKENDGGIGEKAQLFELFTRSKFGETFKPPYRVDGYREMLKEQTRQRMVRDKLMGRI